MKVFIKRALFVFLFILISCSAASDKVKVYVEYTPVEKQKYFEGAVEVMKSLNYNLTNPVLCKSQSDCDMWETCMTWGEFRYEGEIKKVRMPIDMKSAYTRVIGVEGICIDVACKDKCNISKNIPHTGCCNI